MSAAIILFTFLLGWYLLFQNIPDKVEKKLREGNRSVINDVNRSSENINNNVYSVEKTVTSSTAEVGDKVTSCSSNVMDKVQNVGDKVTSCSSSVMDKVQNVGEKVILLDNNFKNFNNNFQSQVFTKIEKLYEDSLKKDGANDSSGDSVSLLNEVINSVIEREQKIKSLEQKIVQLENLVINSVFEREQKIKNLEKKIEQDEKLINNLKSNIKN